MTRVIRYFDYIIIQGISTKPHERVATYIRKGTPHLSTNSRPDIITSSDIIAITIHYGALNIDILNIYNAGIGRQTQSVSHICNLNPDPLHPTLIAGDFNLHHPAWSLSNHTPRPPSALSTLLFEWTTNNSFTVINDLTCPTRVGRTNQQDSIIDLTLANLATRNLDLIQQWSCNDTWSIDSDHNSISWILCPPPPDVDSQLLPIANSSSHRIDPTRQKEWTSAFLNLLAMNPYPTTYITTEDIDAAANNILNAMTNATKSTMPTRSTRTPNRAKWWNDECDHALANLRTASNRPQARAQFRATIRSAKREWATDILIKTPQSDIWGLCNWAAGKPPKRIPPLRGPNGMISNPADQATLFANTFFPPAHSTTAHSLPTDPPPRPERELPHITQEEVRNVLQQTSNTSAPGKSGSSWRLIKWAFEASPNTFISLFNASLQLCHHPLCLKTAIIAIVPKPNKPDKSNPNAYRPVALLECLSKLLEKVIAKRITYEVGRHHLVQTNQFGGRDKSSVIDACLSLTHDIQTAWKNGLTATALTMDIKGYSNNINHDRLTHSLHILGFAHQIVGWVRSFLSNRQISFRINNHITDPIPLAGIGIPQGSPLSPILSTIYTFNVLTVMREVPNASLKSYVDDILLLATTSSHTANITKLEHAADTVIQRLHELGLSIDPEKTELIHFSRARIEPPGTRDHLNLLPRSTLPRAITPIQNMRWLGVFFDKKLSFKTHVEMMATRAQSTLAGLRILANSIRGLSIANARLLYKTVILPVLTFASPVWFTGIRQKGLIRPLERAQADGLRWLLGTFRTTPIAEMHHIGSILPIPHLLRQLSANMAIRLHSLPSSSQVLARLPPTWPAHDPDIPTPPPTALRTPTSQPTIIYHIANLTHPKCEKTLPYFTPPWNTNHNWGPRLLVSCP